MMIRKIKRTAKDARVDRGRERRTQSGQRLQVTRRWKGGRGKTRYGGVTLLLPKLTGHAGSPARDRSKQSLSPAGSIQVRSAIHCASLLPVCALHIHTCVGGCAKSSPRGGVSPSVDRSIDCAPPRRSSAVGFATYVSSRKISTSIVSLSQKGRKINYTKVTGGARKSDEMVKERIKRY